MNRFKCDFSSRFRILKGGKISLVVSALLGSVTLSFAAPSGESVVSGGVAIDRSIADTTNINQSTHKSIINWQDFSIGANETVNFNMPSSTSSSLNRVIGNNPSNIYGKLNSNGQVFLVNQNGVYFGQNSQVNTAGFVASTQNITDENFLNGNYIFEGNSEASIINFGTINTDNAYTALLAKTVQNEGVIKATLGNVQLASGEKITLDINGNSLVKLTIDKGTLDGLVENKGAIYADGGQVYMTTQALDEVLNGLVNNTGVIEANTIEEKEGKIILFAHGGTGEFGGELNAKSLNSGDGGFIETSGTVVKIDDNIKVNTLATDGKTGKWLIDPNDFTIASSGGDMTASTVVSNLATTDFEIETATMGTSDGSGNIYVNENITWSNATKLTLTAENEVHVNAKIENTNTSGGGVYFDALNNHSAVQFDSNGKVVIHNADQLQWMNTALNGTYELGSNVDLTGVTWTRIGYDENFEGSLDGLGHEVSNLSITADEQRQSFFAHIGESGVVKNIGLTNININTNDNWYFGGIAAFNYGTISNSYTTGTITGGNVVGGLVGGNESTGEILNSYSTININTTFKMRIGGIAGSNSGKIENSYATGNVSGNQVGGLVGQNADGEIINSYSTGQVSGHATGGLVGDNYGGTGTVTNSFWDTQTSGQATSAGGTGKTTADMYDSATYTGWNNTVWSFGAGGAAVEGYEVGEGLPYLTNVTRNQDKVGLTTLFESGWGGTSNGDSSAYTITNATQLQNINQVVNDGFDFELSNDIDLSSITNWTPIGSTSANFTGDFDGQGYVIDSLTISDSTDQFQGLFGYVSGSSIKNIGVTGVDITTTENDVGGLVGDIYDSNIENSYVTGRVEAGYGNVGGLVGSATNITISKSYASVDVVSEEGRTGGLVGNLRDGSINDSYAMGSVTGTTRVGGLVGQAATSTDGSLSINNTYSTATVTSTVNAADSVGGLIGAKFGGDSVEVSNSYWDTTTGMGESGDDNFGATGKTTDELYDSTTYTGWDNTVWSFGAGGAAVEGYEVGEGLPYLTQVTRAEDVVSGSTYTLFASGWGGQTDQDQTGSDGSAYTITTAEQLQNINQVVNDGFDFELSNDIDLQDVTWTSIGDSSNSFTGSFDGLNNTISNLNMQVENEDSKGLFGVVSNGTIKNVGIEDAAITITHNDDVFSRSSFGILAGRTLGTTLISNVYTTGSINSIEGNVINVGGIVGEQGGASDTGGTLENSYSTATVSAAERVGGLVGISYGEIKNSYATGKVDGIGGSVGGLVGTALGSIENSYATGNVDGKERVGGLVGRALASSIKNSYATGVATAEVPNNGVGGLVGSGSGSPTVTNSYWNSDAAHLEGINDIGEGKTLTELKAFNTFASWGNDIIEDSTLSVSYPKLAWSLNRSDAVWIIGSKSETTTNTPKQEQTTTNTPTTETTTNTPTTETTTSTPTQEQTTTTKQEQTIQTIVNNAIKPTSITPRVPVVATPSPTQQTDVSTRRVQSSIAPVQTVDMTTSTPVATRSMSDTIKSTVPGLSGSNSNFTLVSKTDGEAAVSRVSMEELQESSTAQFGEVSEIRVALAPDSFVELVNGGVSLPTGVSQEFYVVEEK